jgi:hypothetical protein
MNEDERRRDVEARFRAQLDALKNAAPLEKARTFLRTYCAIPQGLGEIQEQVEHAMNFNPIPIMTGLEGLETVLANPELSPELLVSLVKQDGRQHRVPATPEGARRFLEELVALLHRVLGDDEPPVEPVIFFSPGEVFPLEDAQGHVQPLRCVEMIQVDGVDYAVFVPGAAPEMQGPYTVYHYTATSQPNMTYERIMEPALVERVIEAFRASRTLEPS